MKVLTEQSIKKKIKSMLQELSIYYPGKLFNISIKGATDKISLTIEYCDGPIRSKIKNILQPFTSGCYTDTGERCIYLAINRSMSKEVEAGLLAETKRILRIDKSLAPEDILPAMNQTAGAYIQEIFRFREFL